MCQLFDRYGKHGNLIAGCAGWDLRVVGYLHPPLSPSINNNIPQYSLPPIVYSFCLILQFLGSTCGVAWIKEE